jgi:16S rRNA A1518/A1519 N6-dimethyltransferase RsmA/KsgA/DIM1 with predicted DNA glycosylase/AP lyase activity
MTIVLIVFAIFVAIFGVGVLFGAPFVPTRKIWIRDALDLAKISRTDVVVDLGSGDGAVLKSALEFGAKTAIGYEINPVLVLFSRFRLRKFHGCAKVLGRDFFRENLPRETTIIYLFGVGRIMPKVAKFLKQQRPDLRAKTVKVVTFGFNLPGATAKAHRGGMNLYEI